MKIGIYEHYKGQRYEVIDTLRHSETEELMVLYRALYGDQGLWARPYTMFFQTVLIKNKETPRFKYIGDENE
ncbi:DUF1653 domain-containing protein [Sulfurimonas sp.]|jgi:hypothetical protein|uniref:DUF1653 domain-containing protein n=1 Tax=Sulfurimonas sp. TaxID=2022749 RepID=UPI0025FD28DE|nr:DUF1653 domain-containing protein [Sulfurimonas sp.]MBT5934502.1 DUF1653 domain-containing protein [Sulfurimonas sp.]